MRCYVCVRFSVLRSQSSGRAGAQGRGPSPPPLQLTSLRRAVGASARQQRHRTATLHVHATVFSRHATALRHRVTALHDSHGARQPVGERHRTKTLLVHATVFSRHATALRHHVTALHHHDFPCASGAGRHSVVCCAVKQTAHVVAGRPTCTGRHWADRQRGGCPVGVPTLSNLRVAAFAVFAAAIR